MVPGEPCPPGRELEALSPPPFQLFGIEHVATMALTVAGAWALSHWTLREPRSRVARAVPFALALFLLASTTAVVLVGHSGGIPVVHLLPFHLCDLTIFLAAIALVWRIQAVYEIVYFWALGGTLLAMLTPEVTKGFPDLGCLSFFGIHGGVVVAASVLTWGLGMRPRSGAAWRVFAITNLYAGVVAIVNVAAGTNFMYLRAKPTTPTLLDWLGPWPWYLLAADVLALGLFQLLALPVRASRKSSSARGGDAAYR